MLKKTMKLVVINYHGDFVDIATKKFENCPLVSVIGGNVESLNRENTVFVSPANSFHFMCGGIDKVYSQSMFPGIESVAKAAMRRYGFTTKLGRPYFPLTSSHMVPAVESTNTWLMCTPTMWLPQDVSKTRNAYAALLSSLCCLEKYNANPLNTRCTTLVCPGLCTGWGKMPAEVAAQQMYDAYMDFCNGVRPTDLSPASSKAFIVEEPKDDQPCYYENKEFKDFPNNMLQRS